MASEDELSVVEQWIVTTLNSDPKVAGLILGRIYDVPPPENTEYPYVIYSLTQATDVRGVGVVRIMSDTLYTVKAVMGGEETQMMRQLTAAIDSALTLDQPVAVGTVGSVLSSVREGIVKINEFTAGNHYTHRGGDYRIFAQAN